MKLSRAGLAFCMVYVLASVAIWVYASNRVGDPKGTFVLKQLPVAFAAAAAEKLGLFPLMEQLPGLVVWAMLFLPTVAVIYCIGWAVGWFFDDLKNRG